MCATSFLMRWVPLLLCIWHRPHASLILAAWLTRLAPVSAHLHQHPVVLVDGAHTPCPADVQSFPAMLAAVPLHKALLCAGALHERGWHQGRRHCRGNRGPLGALPRSHQVSWLVRLIAAVRWGQADRHIVHARDAC